MRITERVSGPRSRADRTTSPKPVFSPKELEARISPICAGRAGLGHDRAPRRSGWSGILRVGDLMVGTPTAAGARAGRAIGLTYTEIQLLEMLFRRARRCGAPRFEILRAALGLPTTSRRRRCALLSSMWPALRRHTLRTGPRNPS